MRLFIAVNFNNETRERLIALREELRSRSRRGNYTPRENLHLTLVFIGEASPKQVDEIMAVMDTVVFEPFPATIERLGNFSHGTLWWAGLSKNITLMNLQRELEHKLALCGFKTDERDYHPHITLGREVMTDAVPRAIEPFGETVSGIELMKSERIGGKLIYTAIYSRTWKGK